MIHRRCWFLLTTILLTVLMVVGLVACSSNGKKWNPDDYTVKSGDTVYGIAWRYELDPEEFAAWNAINSSHFIKPGQRLHTRKPYNFDATSGAKRASDIAYAPQTTGSVQRSGTLKWVKASKGDTLYGLSKRYGVNLERLVQLNQLKKPYTIVPGQTIFLKPLDTTAKTVTSTGTNKAAATNNVVSSTGKTSKTHWPKTVRWQRPAKGKVVKKFNQRRNDAKGIDIAGKLGQAIVASADGKVVYSGDGLISYGNLIIIKHNKTYLSAYAYNRKLLVNEGDKVKSGQKIAEMGRKDKLSPRLHFEIRKHGKPVDPQKYLPW
ncbi:MAG: peptidoglycan DD-metalloendopeptidase family protein [Gammaproteobacteria bacterium]